MKQKDRNLYGRCRAALCITGLALLMELSGCALQDGKLQEPESGGAEKIQEPTETAQVALPPNVRQEELILQGFSGELNVLFLTDTHVVVLSEDDSEEEAEYVASRYPMFLDPEGVSAAEHMDEWLEFADREKVDVLLLGGDIIDQPTAAAVEYLDSRLFGLGVPYLYTLGNHDWTFPWEYMTDAGKEAYLPFFEPHMGGNTAVHMWENDLIRIIAVDNSSGQINPDAMEAYGGMLKTAKPVIVLLHVPFANPVLSKKAQEVWENEVVIGDAQGEIPPDDNTSRFLELTTAADSPVEAVLAGHVHFYDKGYLEGEKRVLQIVGDAGYHDSAIWLHVAGESE